MVLIGLWFWQKGKMLDYQDSAADFGDNARKLRPQQTTSVQPIRRSARDNPFLIHAA
jgi:hypothetical protein